jgi:hypothetical protein
MHSETKLDDALTPVVKFALISLMNSLMHNDEREGTPYPPPCCSVIVHILEALTMMRSLS